MHFHPLFQLQLMGLNGAFLTGDLFNLFVFFEVMLAASYGLLLHGSGRLRVQAGLHYIAVNLAASSLFLIGAALLYGVTGTLNMADLGVRIAQLAPADRGLLHAAAAILAIAFLAKAGAWPLNFWLVPAYSAAVSPVGALFALLTKVGIYAVLRLWTLLFAPDTGASAQFGQGVLITFGLATLFVGALGIVGTQRLSNLAGFSVLVSAGTLLAAIGFGQPAMWAGALYYLLSSTLAVSAFFLLIDLIERWRNAGASIAPHEAAGDAPFLSEDLRRLDDVNLDDDAQALNGRAIPAGVAFLGLSFVGCTLLLAGLPPLSGFVGKFAMLSGLLRRRAGHAGRLDLHGAAARLGLLHADRPEPHRHPPLLDAGACRHARAARARSAAGRGAARGLLRADLGGGPGDAARHRHRRGPASRRPPTARPCSARGRCRARPPNREPRNDEALAAVAAAVARPLRRLAAAQPVAGCRDAPAGGDPRHRGAAADPVPAARDSARCAGRGLALRLRGVVALRPGASALTVARLLLTRRNADMRLASCACRSICATRTRWPCWR